MTREQKDLLLKELCARIPYGVKVNAPFTSNRSENAKGYKINSINFGVIEWTPVLFGEKKQRNSIVIEAFSEKYNQYCSIDLEVNDDIERVKLYLFPLSSMTEEQCYDFYCRFIENEIDYEDFKEFYFENNAWHKMLTSIDDCDGVVDWFNENHFDHRGLIPMGSAIDATGLNIY